MMALRPFAAALLLFSLCGCLELDYYLHAATGHLQIISQRQAIPALLQKPDTPKQLQTKLAEIQALRDFASNNLQLPENGSYRSFVQLDRPYVVWNVIATPEFSLTPEE
jgi:predicted aminopeptidase